ncbi:hypothetical protein HZF05_20830 [Sphingomonas sp. CGMCC 1.13654]|uniref:DUF3138 family protein n=1 Tax=Sphingomonas chungangi TaxID=2683589 RepID=A0A838LBE0_9SPHN|nr:hypothetical protein [Sphingomonas chungangi]MBA2936534.1 hypothetical protein [Sphingomonas chungangi]MVW55919.1 hypothetical protein [Sphingomonas chungangi]
MKIRTALLATAAANMLIAGAADAATHKKAHRAATSSNAALLAQVKALQSEVESLRGEVETQRNAQTVTAARVDTTESALQTTQTQVQAVQQQVAATPPVTKDQVNSQIASAIDKEHHNDKFYFKGITIQPGGFLELSDIYRSRFQGDDIASSFNVPFPGQSHASHTSENRFSARQSRVSLLAQGAPNAHTKLAMYGEFDFQGGAQTSNSNQSNSYVPRIRNLYGTVDWDEGSYGLHVLAGQNWSLLTMQSKGITPRSEVTPPQIDAQYVPGFAWARQPGIRLVGDFMDHHLWLGVSAENPQTTFGGSGLPGTVVSVVSGQGSSQSTSNQVNPAGGFQQFYNGVGSSLSLNHTPDFIGKVAYEDKIAGHTVHIEGFGIYRTFSTHLDGTSTNRDAHAFGYGGSIALNIVPKVLDVQLSGIGGRGIGRYGSAGLPDVTADAEGNLHPLKEFMLLAGGTLHATPQLDIYAFAGEEQERRQLYDGGTKGLGVLNADNSGCFVEAPTTATAFGCAGNTRRIRQLTAGAWDKIYNGSFGRAQIGFQWSYTQRQLFDGTGAGDDLPAYAGMPQTHNNMAFVTFRYYPF